ncbi:MAG: class I SAM-dependent methyltransferase [Promethearchaeota archaeon]
MILSEDGMRKKIILTPDKIIQIDIDKVYKNIPLDKIPWNYGTPPYQLKDLIKSGKIKPCKTIDLGCGTGNYAIYFANKGYEVTGIDISPSAISYAKKNAIKAKIECNFLVADIISDLNKIRTNFDFAYDWEVLHHIFPEHRQKYLENVYKILNKHGKYLSVCFSEKDPIFKEQGKYRKTPLGTVLYCSSEVELENIFKTFFKIIELKTIEIRGKPTSHLAIYAFMERL